MAAHISTRKLTRKLSITACMLITTSYPLYADDQSNTPYGTNYQIKASEDGAYESNPLKIAHGAQSIWGSVTTPELLFNSDTVTSKFDVDTSLVENIYSQAAFDSTDFHGKLDTSRQNELWYADMAGKIDYDTTRSSELTTFGLNLPFVRHFGVGASPQVSYNYSPVDTFSVAGSAANSSYSNAAFVDYDFLSISPAYARHLTPNDSVILSLNDQRYDTQKGPNNTVDSYGPTVGWKSVINQRLTTNLSAGFEKSSQDSEIATSRSTNMNYVFRGDLAYSGDQDLSHITASRSHQPFGNGTEALLDAFTVSEAHTLNETTSFNAAATYDNAEYDTIVGVNLNHQFNASMGLSYRLMQNLDVTGNYQFSEESLTNVNGYIRDNAVLFGITYHPSAAAF